MTKEELYQCFLDEVYVKYTVDSMLGTVFYASKISAYIERKIGDKIVASAEMLDPNGRARYIVPARNVQAMSFMEQVKFRKELNR